MSVTARRPTDVSLPEALVAEAKALEVNRSRACEAGLDAAVKDARARLWKVENAAAMESWAEPLERHGLPLARFDLHRLGGVLVVELPDHLPTRVVAPQLPPDRAGRLVRDLHPVFEFGGGPHILALH